MLMILTRSRRKRWRKGSKNKNKKGERWLKKQTVEKKRKQEESKVKEKGMWKRLGELNKEFNEVKKCKKDSKKM